MTIRQIDLGADAIAYMRASLAQGKSLARASARLALEAGRTVALLPSGADPQAARQFYTGGVARTAETEPVIVRLVLDFLAGGADRLGLFEDAVALPTDASLALHKVPFVTSGTDVLYVVRRAADAEEAARALRFATSHVLLGVLTTVVDGLPRAGEAIPDTLLATLTARADKLLIGAYDGESVLIWSRHE